MGRRSAAPVRRAPAPAPAKKPTQPAPVQQKTAQPAPQQQAQMPVAQVSSGPSLLGMIGANVAGAAAGHVIGRGIADTIFGGREGASAEPAMAAADVQQQQNPCNNYFSTLQKCMDDSRNDIS